MNNTADSEASVFRFKRLGQSWVVEGERGRPGRVVQIPRRSGELATVILTEPANPGWHFVNAGEYLENIAARDQQGAEIFAMHELFQSGPRPLSVHTPGETGYERGQLEAERTKRLWTVTAVSANRQRPSHDLDSWYYIVAAVPANVSETARHRAAQSVMEQAREQRARRLEAALSAWEALDGPAHEARVWGMENRRVVLVEGPDGVLADVGVDTIRLIFTLRDEYRAQIRELPRTAERLAAVELLGAIDSDIADEAYEEYVHRS